jgi:serine/threonine protein kinase
VRYGRGDVGTDNALCFRALRSRARTAARTLAAITNVPPPNGVAVRTELEDGRHYTLALQPGTLLDGIYRITRVLGQSSTFAITYLAQDARGGDPVVIKEFLPRTLAGRGSDELTVLAHSAEDEATLARALRRFKREAELLADIAHPHVPRVRRSFEANRTAYLVFQHYEGKTLTEHVNAAGDRLPTDLAAGLVLQVLHGLGALHAEGIIHGYITPDNILVDANCRALVLGLGTTRHVVGPGREPVAGFAAIEQYAAREVGPWTDVYACAAVLYRLTTGLTPPSAVERSAGQMVSLPLGSAATLPPALARTVMSALAQLPDTRPHSAEEFRRRLDASLAIGAEAVAPRADRRPSNARWAAPAPAEPAAEAAPKPKREPESPRYDEEVVFVTNGDGPRDRVRRLVRLVLGMAGAAAGIVLMFSVLGGRKDDWGDGVVVAAPTAPSAPTAIATTQESPGSVSPSPVERASRPQPVADARAQPSGTPQPVLKQASSDPPRAPSNQEERPARSRPRARPRTVENAATSEPDDAEAAALTAAPPSITLSLPSTVEQPDVLPTELLAGLRERLAHGNENLEYGEYARARQIYGAVLDRVAKLGDRYGGTQAFLRLKQDLEQASERALAACTAENEVIRRRNGKAVQCE